MKNIFVLLSATTALTMAANAYAADESSNTQSSMDYKKNGGYESTVKSDATSAEGTDTKSKTTMDVDVDSNGKASKEIKSSSTTDPEGMMNKKTHNGKLTYEDKDNGGYKKTVTSKDTDAAGTNTSVDAKTTVDVDSKGNVTKTEKSDKVTDPKGLWNKTETVSKKKTVNGEVVEDTKETK